MPKQKIDPFADGDPSLAMQQPGPGRSDEPETHEGYDRQGKQEVMGDDMGEAARRERI